ncbi:MAG: DUF1016 N-terminal domain-containing protein [Leptospiraceae bacterium]|nr:DUF1016 N-terminal domain-containing protein [Leptospiraceae bacterium]
MNWNLSILASNWKIGRRIIEVEQDSKLRAKYSERLLITLSQELNRKLGSGFSARNLRYMRQFYLVYKKQNFQPKVSWSHYREIVSLESKSERDKLEKLVLEQQITVRELNEIKNELLSSNSGQTDNGFYSEEDESVNGAKLLRKPVLQLFTYRVDRKFSMNLAHSVPNLAFILQYLVVFENCTHTKPI